MNMDTVAVRFAGLDRVFNVSKTLVEFTIPFTQKVISIKWYGAIIAFGFLLAVLFGGRIAYKWKISLDKMVDVLIYGTICGIIGARLYYVVFSWDYYGKHPAEIINIRQGGLAIYGGVIAALLTCFVYTRIKKMSFKLVADTGIYGLILGQIIGRWGNFFNREAFGGVAGDGNPWAMKIFFGDEYQISQVPDAVRESMEAWKGKSLAEIGYIQVQPTFLYESLWNIMVLTLMLIFRKKKKFDGEILLWYLIGYGVGRAIIEGMRTDQLIMPITGWPVSKALSIVVASTSLIIVIVKRIQLAKQK